MKKTSISCLLALLSLVSVAGSQAGGGTEKAVAALEQQWLQGQKTNNADLVAPLLADKIVVTEADGKGGFGKMVCLHKTQIDAVNIADAIGQLKTVNPHGQIVNTARAIGICFGD